MLIWIAWLAIRYRSATLFTAANPAIPAGGFIGESKADILEGLGDGWVAPFRLIDGSLPYEEKLSRVREFVNSQGSSFPVVLKPDAGQRGTGVKIANDWPAVGEYCRLARMDFLVQRFVPGVEYGVFYVRKPGQPSGRVFSVTEKVLPSVQGNGTSTLSDLVLADPRAVCLAPLYLEALGRRCAEVPAEGVTVSLTDLGTHCRGAVFLDGGHLLTPELEATIDRISKSFEGFHFGRYDIRVPSQEDLLHGRNLQIVELNGVTSEATHIYDPKNSIFDAYLSHTLRPMAPSVRGRQGEPISRCRAGFAGGTGGGLDPLPASSSRRPAGRDPGMKPRVGKFTSMPYEWQ